MRFSTASAFLAALAAPLLVAAQMPNAFKIPQSGLNATAGSSTTLNWTPSTSGTVSLILRSGASSDLAAGSYIAKAISNSGSYVWSVPSDIVRGSDYTVEIVDDSDPSQNNYTPYFVIDSTNTVASVTMSAITEGASTGTRSVTMGASSSAASMSGSATTTGTVTTTASGSMMTSGSSSMMTSGSSGSRSGSASSTNSGASFQGTSTGSSSSPSASSQLSGASASFSIAGAFQLQAAAIVLGLLAMGALVL